MGSESLILLCQFESICLSCFRIVIDFLLFSLIFFFFQCFSVTTLTVIIKSAFDLFWLPRSPSWITLLHDVFTTRLFYFYGAQVWFLRNFCTLNHLNFALFSKSRHHFFVNDFISTNVTLHQRVHIREQKEQRSFCNDGPGIKSFRNTVLEYEPLADWSILCLCTDAPHPPPPLPSEKKSGRGRSSPSPILSEGSERGGGGASVHRLFDFNFSLSVPVLTVIGKNCELAHFYIHLTSKQRRTFLKVDFKALAKNNPMSDCWQCQNHRT